MGGGDSFASGLVYGFLAGKDPQWAVECGAAHGALAMTTPGRHHHGDPGRGRARDEGRLGARPALAAAQPRTKTSRPSATRPRRPATGAVLDSLRRGTAQSLPIAAMEHTLVLNATYEPLRIVSWQKAMTLLFQGKVEVIAVYDREIRGVTVRVKLPSVLRLLRHVRMKRPFADVPFSRANVYARDEHRCQYCGHRFPPSQLTFDHVVPVARGGHKGWDNIVTCCIPCNRRKGDRLPEEAGFA